MKLYYPVKPVHINQPFGANEAYYKAKFGTNGHTGIDFMAAHGQPVYAAHDGNALYLKDSHGGEGIWNFSTDGTYATIYWHLIGDTDPNYKLPIPFDSTRCPVTAGEIIGYADNTGAPFESTGDHLHFGLVMIDPHGTVMNQDNGFGGCIDPEPYFNGICAQDIATLIPLERALVVTLTNIVNYYLNKNK